MGRRSRPRRPPVAPPPSLGAHRRESGPGGEDYEVRAVTAGRATKVYRCPGCDHEIAVAVAHVVVWPADDVGGGLDERRHWHTGCWGHRGTRGPTRRWS